MILKSSPSVPKVINGSRVINTKLPDTNGRKKKQLIEALARNSPPQPENLVEGNQRGQGVEGKDGKKKICVPRP